MSDLPSSPGSTAPSQNVPDDKKATEHLANERTFLAWVRTSIAIVSLGFVVAKFGLWLDRMVQLTPAQTGSGARLHLLGWSMPMGAGMMVVGALLSVLAAWHHHRVSLQIEAGKVEPAARLVVFVSALVTLLAALMVTYLLASAN